MTFDFFIDYTGTGVQPPQFPTASPSKKAQLSQLKHLPTITSKLDKVTVEFAVHTSDETSSKSKPTKIRDAQPSTPQRSAAQSSTTARSSAALAAQQPVDQPPTKRRRTEAQILTAEWNKLPWVARVAPATAVTTATHAAATPPDSTALVFISKYGTERKNSGYRSIRLRQQRLMITAGGETGRRQEMRARIAAHTAVRRRKATRK